MTVESSPGAGLSVPFAPLGGLTHPVPHHAPLPPPEEDPLWFQRAVFYEVLIRGFFDGNNDGVGRHPRAHRQAGLPPVARRGLPVAAALLPLAAARRWLRHQRLLLGPPRVRHRRRPEAPARGGPRPGHPGHRRPGHQPHQRPEPVVHRVPLEPRQPQGRLVRVERRRPTLAGGPGGLHRRGAVQLGLRRPAGPVLLAPLLLPPARPQLRQPRGGRGHARRGPVLAGPGARRVPARRRPLPVPEGRHRRREPARDPRLHPADAGRARGALPGPDPAGRGQRVAVRRGRLLRRRRRVPPVLQLPADAPAVHGRPARAELSRHRDPGPDPRGPRAAPSGPSSCATTTS